MVVLVTILPMLGNHSLADLFLALDNHSGRQLVAKLIRPHPKYTTPLEVSALRVLRQENISLEDHNIVAALHIQVTHDDSGLIRDAIISKRYIGTMAQARLRHCKHQWPGRCAVRGEAQIVPPYGRIIPRRAAITVHQRVTTCNILPRGPRRYSPQE